MKHKKRSILQRFTALYFVLLLICALLVGALVVSAASGSVNRLELHSMQAALDLLAVDVQAQTDAMERAAQSILINNLYRLSVLKSNKYNEVEMLRHFANFAQATALSDTALLFYEGESMVYQTDGHKTDFPRFCRARYGLTAQSAQALQEQIMLCGEDALFGLAEYGGADVILFVYPIRFPGSVSHSEARLAFAVPERRLRSRMQALSAYSFEDYALSCGETMLLPPENPARINMRAQTADGRFTVAVAGYPSAFAQALEDNLPLVVALVLGMVALFSFLSFLLAKHTSKPIRDLAARYGIGMHDYDEYLRLETAFLTLEQENREALQTARQQLLRLLLSGGCPERALSHGEHFGVRFPYEMCSAFVMPLTPWQDEQAKKMCEEIEAFTEEDSIFYAVPRPEESCVAILVCFKDEYLYGEAAELLTALSGDKESALQCGTVCQSPLDVHYSYSQACQAAGIGEETAAPEQSQQERAAYFLQQAQSAFRLRDRRAYDAAMAGLGELVAEDEGAGWLKSHVYQQMLLCLEHEQAAAGRMDVKTFADLMEAEDFGEFSRRLFEAGESGVCGTQQEQADTVHRMILFIYKNVFDCDFSLGALADEFSLSGDYISRLIKAQTGRTFKEYVVELRMNEAKGLLTHRMEWTIAEVAAACGYRSASNFIKQFRDCTGCTPLQYRKENGDVPREADE